MTIPRAAAVRRPHCGLRLPVWRGWSKPGIKSTRWPRPLYYLERPKLLRRRDCPP